MGTHQPWGSGWNGLFRATPVSSAIFYKIWAFPKPEGSLKVGEKQIIKFLESIYILSDRRRLPDNSVPMQVTSMSWHPLLHKLDIVTVVDGLALEKMLSGYFWVQFPTSVILLSIHPTVSLFINSGSIFLIFTYVILCALVFCQHKYLCSTCLVLTEASRWCLVPWNWN